MSLSVYPLLNSWTLKSKYLKEQLGCLPATFKLGYLINCSQLKINIILEIININWKFRCSQIKHCLLKTLFSESLASYFKVVK
jgi:hypothetical protein